jgi:hypothetical protein
MYSAVMPAAVVVTFAMLVPWNVMERERGHRTDRDDRRRLVRRLRMFLRDQFPGLCASGFHVTRYTHGFRGR